MLAVNYFALVTSDDPAAPGPQTWMALLGLSAQGIAVLGGLLAYFCDMKRNYHRAKALQATDRSARDSFFKERDRWRQRQQWSVRTLNLFFVTGVIAAVTYVALRLLKIGASGT